MIGHVVLDALFLDPGVSGGPETYMRSLVPALARARPGLRLTVITSRRGAVALRRDGWEQFAAVEALPSDDTERVRKLLSQQWLLPRRARALGADLVHSLSNLAPIRAAPPQIITLFDVIFLHQRSMGLLSRVGIGTVVRRSAPRAQAVITLSEVSRRAILDTLALDKQRVVVIPPGVSDPPDLAADIEEVRARRQLPSGRIVLCVAAKRPHKNQELLLRALPALPADVSVVCAGHDDGYQAALAHLADDLGVGHRLRLLDYLPESELEALWRMAACAALPTRAEGFGLPVLEAMRRGVPVACSDIPVLREVAAQAAQFFDPDDPGDAAAAIMRAIDDLGAGQAGRARAARFSWEHAAEATLAMYERAVAPGTR